MFFLSFFGNDGVRAVIRCGGGEAAEGDTYRPWFIIYGLYFLDLLEFLEFLELLE